MFNFVVANDLAF